MPPAPRTDPPPATSAADPALPADAREVLAFWFGAPDAADHCQPREMWFRRSDALDGEIRRRFGTLVERALRGELRDWTRQPWSALARLLLLDQFTRNIFRGTPRAFAGDVLALPCAREMVDRQQDMALPPVPRGFVYLPFEHAEDVAAQAASVRLFTQLAQEAPQTADMLDYAQRHQAVIQRFGRFPHRNAILGRQSTDEEIEFLRQPGSSF